MLAGAWDSWRASARQACGSLQLPVPLSSYSRTLVQAERTQGAKCGTRCATKPLVFYSFLSRETTCQACAVGGPQ